MPQIGYQDQFATGLQVSLTHSLTHSFTAFTPQENIWTASITMYNALWRGPGSMPWTCWHPFHGWKPYSNLFDLGLAWHSIFARSRHGLWQFIHSLVIEPVLLNAEKTVVPTNDAQPLPIFATNGGLKLTILQRNVGQKWRASMLTATRWQSRYIDLEHHLLEASKFHYANRWLVLDRSVSISKRLK